VRFENGDPGDAPSIAGSIAENQLHRLNLEEPRGGWTAHPRNIFPFGNPVLVKIRIGKT